MEYLNDTPYFFQLYIIFAEGSNMNGTLNEEEIIDNLCVYRKNTPIFGMVFGNLEVIDSNEYVAVNHSSTQDPYIRCRCGICGKISLKRRSNLICGRYDGCSKCYENINDEDFDENEE